MSNGSFDVSKKAKKKREIGRDGRAENRLCEDLDSRYIFFILGYNGVKSKNDHYTEPIVAFKL